MNRKSLSILLGLLALVGVFSSQVPTSAQGPAPQEQLPLPPH